VLNVYGSEQLQSPEEIMNTEAEEKLKLDDTVTSPSSPEKSLVRNYFCCVRL